MLHTYRRLGRPAELAFAGALFALGAVCCLFGWRYGVGRANEVGPGAVPVFLGLALMALAGMAAVETAGTKPVERRLAVVPTVLIGIIAWGLLIEPAGMAIANLVLLGACSLAEERLDPVGAVILAAALTGIGYVVFVLGFALPLTLLPRALF